MNIPKPSGEPAPTINPLFITVNGVEKILSGLNVKKASGPDNISCKILRELATELAPSLTNIFNQSLDTGQILKTGLQPLLPRFSKRGTEVCLRTTVQFPLPAFLAKFLNTLFVVTFINIWITMVFFLLFSTAFAGATPANHSYLSLWGTSYTGGTTKCK